MNGDHTWSSAPLGARTQPFLHPSHLEPPRSASGHLRRNEIALLGVAVASGGDRENSTQLLFLHRREPSPAAEELVEDADNAPFRTGHNLEDPTQVGHIAGRRLGQVFDPQENLVADSGGDGRASAARA